MKLVELAKKDESLGSLADHLDRLVSDLQFQVMQARLVPVEQIFARFPRLVRDTAMQMKKEVNFQIIGGEIELDRTIVDKLAEPLVHLLKNAVDHGVGQKGTITLKASREKEFAIITVENDGKNIDWEKIRNTAVSRGIINSEIASRLDKAGLMELLYVGRLSTKEEVTETSGRGIGMSVVKSFAEQNGGRLQVESPLLTGGTRFTLELPLSMAIINSLLMEVDSKLFAIPFSVIDRSVRITSDDIKSMGDQDVAIVGEQNVPLVYLSKLFAKTQVVIGVEKIITEKTDKKINSVLAVLLKRGSETVGLVVDALHDKLEIIVKPLPSVLKKTKGFSGSTILGDGQAILIVDAVSLLEDSARLVRTNNL
ncbi:MAG: chemotaxis protein CheW [Parcubacteria group bacterium]|nr:chemotaxis protein CheW [Parcubacteria group bacterium]